MPYKKRVIENSVSKHTLELSDTESVFYFISIWTQSSQRINKNPFLLASFYCLSKVCIVPWKVVIFIKIRCKIEKKTVQQYLLKQHRFKRKIRQIFYTQMCVTLKMWRNTLTIYHIILYNKIKNIFSWMLPRQANKNTYIIYIRLKQTGMWK